MQFGPLLKIQQRQGQFSYLQVKEKKMLSNDQKFAQNSLFEGEHYMSGQLAHVTLNQEKLEDNSLHVFGRRDFENNIIKFL